MKFILKKNFCSSKDTTERRKGPTTDATDWKKIFVINISNKELNTEKVHFIYTQTHTKKTSRGVPRAEQRENCLGCRKQKDVLSVENAKAIKKLTKSQSALYYHALDILNNVTIKYSSGKTAFVGVF